MNNSLLQSLFCGRNHRHFQTIDSTNSELKRLLADEKLPEGTLITCEVQNAGRGYTGNTWSSERGQNIMMSLLLQPTFLQVRFQFYLNQVVSLAIYDALEKWLDKEKMKIKWPNDIMYKDKKMCGILIENTIQGSLIQHSIIGIGLNVNETGWKKKNLKHATSLKQNLKKEIDTTKLIYRICEHIESRYLQLKTNKLEMLQQDYMSRMFRVEKKHYYEINGKKIKAKITGLTPEGKLIVDTQQGVNVFDFKEIVFIL